MWIQRLVQAAGLLSAALPLAAAPAAAPSMTPEQARQEQAYTVGAQAFLYGYPMVELYRIRHRAVFDAANADRTPLNTFRHRRELVDASMRTVVAPNNDTLYSSAWLDLGAEPVVLEVPDTAGRYYVMQLMDFYTNNFAYVGKRTTGTGPGRFAIVGPGWKGTLPAGLKRIDAPTPSVWLLGRTLVDGPADLPAVHALQDQYKLTPLSAWAHTAAPPQPDRRRPPYDPRVPLKFFEILDAALDENPPPAHDAGVMGLLSQIGIGPGQSFSVDRLDPATTEGLGRALQAGQAFVTALPSGRPVVNGWLAFSPHTGRFGTDYRYRAYIARWAIAANDPEEAHNFTTRQDERERPLNGSRRYVLRFDKGQLPPVDAFWSMTMYSLPGAFLVDNPLKRYALGDRSRQLRYGADGSLELYIQHESPGPDKESNWLPAPEGDFELGLRCYLPQAAITERRWVPPRVKAIE